MKNVSRETVVAGTESQRRQPKFLDKYLLFPLRVVFHVKQWYDDQSLYWP